MRQSIAAGATIAVSGLASRAFAQQNAGQAPKKLRILILGGTGFLGPHTVQAALDRGHTVTIFNRGRTERRTGYTFAGEERVERLFGNRDPEKHAVEDDPTSPKGLEQLKGGSWDCVIDNSGYYPRIVRASAELLAPSVSHYTFISTISVYASNRDPGADESAALATIADPTVETIGANFENYGGLKALCEQAAEAAMPGKTANVRPGYIVGPDDPTPRFTYWPVRIARGGEVLVPGSPDDPVQFIDVRDLGAWLVRVAEQRAIGAFNATGPADRLTVGQTLEACIRASGSDARLTYADSGFLRENGLLGVLPIFIPPEGDYTGFHRVDNRRALKAGLVFRSAEAIARDTLEWFNGLPDDRRQTLAGRFFPAEREAELLTMLRERAVTP